MNTQAPPPSAFAACCTEDEVVRLVHGFYARVRQDPLLGPVFERHVHAWDAHLSHLVDFWSALLRGTRRFAGAPAMQIGARFRQHYQLDPPAATD